MKKLFYLLLVLIFLTTLPIIATAESEYGIWEIFENVDEFDLPDGTYHIRNIEPVEGKFSNSATTNSPLLAVMYFNRFANSKDEYIAIRLFEYGQNRVTNPYSKRKEYKITMLGSKSGLKYSVDGLMLSQSADIMVVDRNVSTIKTLLRQGGTVRFSISEVGNSLTKYVFSFEDASGFGKSYSDWKSQ